MNTYDVCIVGGGIVGAAIAFGEAHRGKKVLVLDGMRSDSKASFANFGLVWSQGKGKGMPAYQELTQSSADKWIKFTQEVENISGESLQYENKGGLVFCLGEQEFEARKKHLSDLQKTSKNTQDWEMLGRNETQMRVGDLTLGQDVVGASYGSRDGAVNPLSLIQSLNIATKKLGGTIIDGSIVTSLERKATGWRICSLENAYKASSVVVAAGLGSKAIASKLGIDLPIEADKGQILVTERRPKQMLLPASGLRQNGAGSFMIGATHEGNQDRRSTVASGIKLAQRAIRTLPDLKHVPIVRQWAGHRIITPDTYPIYMRPMEGLTFAVCHSGVTLAAFHSSDWLEDKSVFHKFSANRFMQ